MANPTTNFGWVMPTATDLVTDLPADFAVFGQGVDTSMAYLLGGTTGQILSKTSATNMAFTWINNDQGDITGITATSPLTGGGSSGAITVGIQDATTSVKGSVQLSDSTSTTSSVLAATPTAVKSAYDLADGAIAKTTVTTAGDVIYRNATVPTRLGIGTVGQVLTVNSGATAPEWTTPAAGGGMTLISSTVPSGASSVNFTSISGSYKHLLVLWTAIHTSGSGVWDYRFNNSSGANYFSSYISNTGTTLTSINLFDGTSATDPSAPLFDIGDSQTSNATGSRGYLWIYDYADTTYDKVYVGGSYYYGSNQHFITEVKGLWDQAAAITSVDIVKLSGTSTMTAASRGIIRLYGVS